jgi:DNA-binding NarL/FixJ family response regulator
MITSETSRDRKMIIMRPRESIKVLIADDHDLTRLGIKTLISQQPHCQVVGIAVNGQQAIDLAKIYGSSLLVMVR